MPETQDPWSELAVEHDPWGAIGKPATAEQALDFAGRANPDETAAAILEDTFGADKVERFKGRGADGNPLLQDDPRGPLTDEEREDFNRFRDTRDGLAYRFGADAGVGDIKAGAAKLAGEVMAGRAAELERIGKGTEIATGMLQEPLGPAGNFIIGAGANTGGIAGGSAVAKVVAKVVGRVPVVGPALTLASGLAGGVAAAEGLRALTPPTVRESEAGQWGEVASLVIPAAAGVANVVKGAKAVGSVAGTKEALKFAGGRLGAGAAIGGAGDYLIYEGMKAMGMDAGEYTGDRALVAAILGAGLGNLKLEVRGMKEAQVAGIVESVGREIAQGAKPGTVIDTTTGKPMNSAADIEVYNAVGKRLAAMQAKGDAFVKDPAAFKLRVIQNLQAGEPVGKTRVLTGPVEPGATAAGPAIASSDVPPTQPQSPAPATTRAPVVTAAAGSEVASNVKASVPGGLPIVPGSATVVLGSRGSEMPAVYAWAPAAMVQTSHSGEMMARNPAYVLENTRDYSAPEERDKQLAVLKGFDPRRHVTDAPDAAVGPSLVASVTDEAGNTSLQRLGGNNRGYAIQNLPAAERAKLRELENAKAGQFGLEPSQDPDAELVRYMGEFDLRVPGERARVQGIVDLLNPAPGMVQSSSTRAALDAAAVPPADLVGVPMAIAGGDAKAFVRGLIERGLADRNLTAALAEQTGEAQLYTQRLLMNAAYREPALAAAREDPRAGSVRGILEAAVPALVRMRALNADGNAIADAVARGMVRIVAQPDKLAEALDVVARQGEFDPASIVGQTVADGLKAALVTDAKGRVITDSTAANAVTLFEAIERAVREFQPEPDLFGNVDTVGDAVTRAVAMFKDKGLAMAGEGGKMRAPRAVGPGTSGAVEKPAAVDPEAVAFEKGPIAFSGPESGAYVPVPLAGLDDMRIVEMPEMVALMKELGAEFALKKLPKALGYMLGAGNGRVVLDPRLFQDPVVAAKVLAHEIGHLIDYLPQQTLKRGNLWGRLHSLRNYLKERWSPTGPTNKQLRAELLALTRYWKPYDPATASKSYVRYRESGPELYADFVSVLFNSPATAKAIAPTFYSEFFTGLASKPDIKDALFGIQDWLRRPFMQRQADRRVKIEEMQALGEEAFLRKHEEAQNRFAGYRGFLSRLKQGLFDSFAPVRDRAAAAGTQLGAEVEALFDGHPMSRNEHWRWLERIERAVVKPLEEAGFSLDELGTHLFLKRVAHESYALSERQAAELGYATGGRSVIANPLGHTPKTARDALLAERLRNKMSRQTLLEAAAQKFHDEVFRVMKEAREVGLLTAEQFAMIEGNRDTYATFTPLEYVDTMVPAGIYTQTGTVKEIASPFLQTTLKVLTMQRAIQYQRLKAATVKLLVESFPAEIAPVAMRKGAGGRTEPVPSRVKGRSQLMLRVDGVPTWYEVPAEIAGMFEHVALPLLETALDVLRVPFQKFFYPLFITFNPIFQMVTNPIRDARRTNVNRPDGVGIGAVLRQLPLVRRIGENPALEAVRALVDRSRVDPLIAEMLANVAIMPGDATFAGTAGMRNDAFEKLLSDHGLLPAEEQSKWMPKHWPGIGRVLRAIERAGRINELLPKVDTYRRLRILGWQPEEAAMFVRSYVGTPHFGRRGRHVGILNTILPFINIWTKGWAADATLATKGFPRRSGPDAKGVSPAAWWMRWAMFSAVPRLLMRMATLGLFGAAIKKLYDGIGSHDLKNYDVIPLGYAGASEVEPEGAVAFIRVPKDPTDRVLSGIFDNVLTAFATKAAKAGAFGGEVAELNAAADDSLADALTASFGIGAQDVPGINPMLKIGAGWVDYLSGTNPYDSFRGRHVLSEAEHLVRGWDGAVPMMQWTLGQTGLQSFVRINAKSDTLTEIAIDNLPVMNGLVKVTDYGFRQKQSDAIQAEQATAAAEKLALSRDTREVATEFWYLRALGEKHRTPAQSARYGELRGWYSGVYEPVMDVMQQVDADARPALRARVDEGTKPFVRRVR